MRLGTLFLLCSITFSVSSAELSPAERMLNAMGIDQVLSQSKEAQAKAAQDQVAMVMRQLSGTLAKIPEEQVKEIEGLFQNMMLEITNSWSTEEAIRIYSQTWTDNYTDTEILAVVEKYEQPESQQELQMLLQASANLNEYILGSYNKATEEALAETLPKMQLIIKEALNNKK
ncbi:hypothetical protein [Rheinheimera maricola]|uniref:DUF2059 domain-containing protein n=1 Tax=Rheinheimera maricola TaxID=2793282 RepID=A0ABS7XF65_9GAMM|nr:hypothetical protein [Rheinheimera maricola]MBZ9613769.1 hypothetical protein [Rheinheimera maricola]